MSSSSSSNPFSSPSRDGPNPLRPYYVPPSIGVPHDPGIAISANSTARLSHGHSSQNQSFSSARDILADLDYSEYTDASLSAADMVKQLLDQALWKYMSILLAQPFDVAKTVLQCRFISLADGGATVVMERSARTGRPLYSDEDGQFAQAESDSDPDEPSSYFTSAGPMPASMHSPPPRTTPHQRRRIGGSPTRRTPSRTSSTGSSASKLLPHNPTSILSILSGLWTTEGAWGVWKGSNTTFIYSILLKTIESWTRSLLAAILSIPDPGLLPSGGLGTGLTDIADSPYPLACLGVSVAAAGISALLLAPLDIIRTRLILTPTSQPPRSLGPALKTLPALSCPPSLLAPTLLHATLPTLLTTSTPLWLRNKWGLDPALTPATWGSLTFLSHIGELFVRLPLETVLRRAQIDHVMRVDRRVAPVVEVGPYRGVIGTMWGIVKEEGGGGGGGEVIGGVKGSRAEKKAMRREGGGGVEGLFRGWRVGMWGLVGVWGAAALGGAAGASKGGEF